MAHPTADSPAGTTADRPAEPSVSVPSLDALKARRATARHPRGYLQRTSKLERHRSELVALRERGASLGDMQFWLATLARPAVTASRSTIHRYLHGLRPGVASW